MTYIACWNILYVNSELSNGHFHTHTWIFSFLSYNIYIYVHTYIRWFLLLCPLLFLSFLSLLFSLFVLVLDFSNKPELTFTKTRKLRMTSWWSIFRIFFVLFSIEDLSLIQNLILLLFFKSIQQLLSTCSSFRTWRQNFHIFEHI
jgi:hypothetical protein